MWDRRTSAIAFAGPKRIAEGDLETVTREVHRYTASSTAATPVFVLNAHTSRHIELDLRGTADDAVKRIPEPAEAERKGPGRPRLGVVGREVTLLPRHWDWLNAQPGGASVTLRKLVEQARRAGGDKERLRAAQDAAYRFMLVMAGDLPGYEEANRALYAADGDAFMTMTDGWPDDIRAHARALAQDVFSESPTEARGGAPSGH